MNKQEALDALAAAQKELQQAQQEKEQIKTAAEELAAQNATSLRQAEEAKKALEAAETALEATETAKKVLEERVSKKEAELRANPPSQITAVSKGKKTEVKITNGKDVITMPSKALAAAALTLKKGNQLKKENGKVVAYKEDWFEGSAKIKAELV